MDKKFLTDRQMLSDAACVDIASSWAEVIVKDHYRGPGDLDNAMRAASREAKVPHGFLWKLRYRRSSVKLPPFGYLINLAVAYGKKRRAGAKSRDPKADAVAAEFLKLAETFRGMDADIYRKASDDLLASASALSATTGETGEEGSALADGRGA
jgi:hypothetical protein